MQLLAFADARFISRARREALAMPGASPINRIGGRAFTFQAERADPGNMVFIEALAEVHCALDAAESSDDAIIGAVRGLAGKETFSIEVVNDNVHAGENAKTTEVRLGTALETEGFHVDLKSPAQRIIIERTPAVTLIASRMDRWPWGADPFRNTNNRERISRSSYKLEEALSYFGIGISREQMALDIGSAPGGWAMLLSKLCRVVAVDPAQLDYARFNGNKLKVLGGSSSLPENAERISSLEGIRDFEVLHIASRLGDSLEMLSSVGRFDIITSDANVPVRESASMVLSAAKLMKSGAHLVLTLKLFHRSPNTAMRIASGLLEGFTDISIRKLPHDRDELTLHALKE